MKIAIISDIHEDIVSLEKALKMIEIEKCDQIVCLGDILGYPLPRAKYESTRNASGCISLIKSYCSIVLPGNHDIFHLQKFPEYNAHVQLPMNWYNLSPEEKIAASDNKVWNYSDDHSVILSEQEIEYLASLPEYFIKEFDGNTILFSHSFYPDFTGFISSGHSERNKVQGHFAWLSQNNCNVSLCGHMHSEGLGICYAPGAGLISKFLDGFNYFSFGNKKLKNKNCCITIPALADNGQENGFAIFDTKNLSINALSLNTNRRINL